MKLKRHSDSKAATALPDRNQISERILVVDDNEVNREILHYLFDSWMIRHQTATDGIQALSALRGAAAQGNPFQIAILDMHMPGMSGIDLAAEIKTDSSIADTRLIMLSSVQSVDEAEAALGIGIETWLYKPVRRADLLSSLLQVAERCSACEATDRETVTERPGGDATYQGIRVLVAEDNVVNREVAKRMLESLGCEVVTAENGREAAELFSRAPYHLVLMDCQMPEMDGFEATRLIREMDAAQQNQTRRSHTPIIALTAHAMDGYPERCRAAGMDDFLGKPFERSQLCSILDRWTGAIAASNQDKESEVSASPDTSAAADQSPDLNDLLDEKALNAIRALQSDSLPDLVVQIVDLYLEDAPILMNNIVEALEAGDVEPIYRAAHTLKSSSANVGAISLAALCQELESGARSGKPGDFSNTVTKIDQLLAKVVQALKQVSTQETCRISQKS
jgi:CheY-like chemotaxis protein